MTIKETRQVAAAIVAVLLRWKDSMKDGKLSLLEKAAFLTEYTTIQRALDRISDVPQELLNISPEELPAITADVTNILDAWGISARNQDATALIVSRVPVFIDIIQALIGEVRELSKEIDALPPSALRAE